MSRIDALWPASQPDLTDEQLLETYRPPAGPWLRMNFIASLDGAATRDGHSGGLGDAADRRVFELLRWWGDVVLLGAGTARAEGYGAMRLPADAAAWRRTHGLAPQPVLALVSRDLDLDPDSPVFSDAPVTPLVFTAAAAPPDRRARLSQVAEVLDAGATSADPSAVRDLLHRRGLNRIHSEGGPTLFGAFVAAGAVDELCLTLAPSLEAGHGLRIAHAAQSVPTAMGLAGILRAEDELLLRYTKS